MNQLPAELLDEICDHCDFLTLKSLRATGQYCADVTTPRLFSQFYMGFFTDHLSRLAQLAQTPRIAKHVKHFTFVGDILPEYESPAAWEVTVDLRPSYQSFLSAHGGSDMRTSGHKEWIRLPRHGLSPAQMAYHYDQYEKYRQQQLDWDEKADQMFIDSFSRLPNVFKADNQRYNGAGYNQHPPWPSMRREILVGPDNWKEKHMIEGDDPDRTRGQASDANFEKPIHMRHLSCLLKGILRRSDIAGVCPVTDLTITNIGSQPFFHQIQREPLRGINPWSKQPSMQAFEHVTSLQMTVNYQLWTEGPPTYIWRSQQLATEVQAILHAAKKVRSLRLTLHDEEDGMHHGMEVNEVLALHDLLRLIETPTFPCLEALELSCNTTSDRIEEFLDKNSAKLKSLRLVDSEIFGDGSWEAALRDVPTKCKLDDIYLEGLRDDTIDAYDAALFEDGLDVSSNADEHDMAVRSYFLGGQEEMPALEYGVFHRHDA